MRTDSDLISLPNWGLYKTAVEIVHACPWAIHPSFSQAETNVLYTHSQDSLPTTLSFQWTAGTFFGSSCVKNDRSANDCANFMHHARTLHNPDGKSWLSLPNCCNKEHIEFVQGMRGKSDENSITTIKRQDNGGRGWEAVKNVDILPWIRSVEENDKVLKQEVCVGRYMMAEVRIPSLSRSNFSLCGYSYCSAQQLTFQTWHSNTASGVY